MKGQTDPCRVAAGARAKIIKAKGEFQAAEKPVQAVALLSEQPVALQLRFLQTKIAANCIPSTTSSVVSIPFASSAVIVPSLPTLSSASMSPRSF
jgi:hypothetical protein